MTKRKVWSPKSEVGSRKSEVGSRKSEVGSHFSATVEIPINYQYSHNASYSNIKFQEWKQDDMKTKTGG